MHPTPIVVVTGSSSGIGLHLCLCLARQNFRVVATLRKPTSAPAALRDCCDVQALDVTSEESADALAQYLRRTYSGCDVLINNAGFGCPGTLETVSIEAAKSVFEVNVWGVMRMCQVIAPLMRSRNGGLIVTVSSTSGWRGMPCSDIYTGSKHAVEGMMDSYRYSLQKDNIKVCIVNPGPTNTEFSKRYAMEREEGRRKNGEAPACAVGLTDFYIAKMAGRNGNGQSAEDCAREIAGVVGREFGKRIDGSGSEGERARFWNPTSKMGWKLLSDARNSADGSSGPVYELWWKQSFEALEQVQKEHRGGS